jgi:hypothetical protein
MGKLYNTSVAFLLSDPTSYWSDFSPAELFVGAPIYFVQDDTEALGPIVHKLIVRERSAVWLVVSTRSMNKGMVYGLLVINPGRLEGFFHGRT